MRNPWDDPALVTRAKALWMEGLSTSLVAAALNREFRLTLSRNAVIGKLSRLGINNATRGIFASNQASHRVLPYPANRQSSAKTPSRRPPHVRPLDFRNNPDKPMQRPAPVAPVLEDLTFARPWEQRQRGQCAWPIGESPEVYSCCAPTAARYCQAHAQRMFVPMTSKPRDHKDRNVIAPAKDDDGDPIALDRMVA